MYDFINPRKPTEHDHIYIQTAALHDHHTRHSLQQHHHIPNQSSRTRAPFFQVEHLTRQYTRIWDALPLELRTNKNYASFKKDLKAYLVKKQKLED